MAALSKGGSELRNYAPGADSRSTLICLATLGVNVSVRGDIVTLMGRGLRSFRSPARPRDAGTTSATEPARTRDLTVVGRNPTRIAFIGVLRKVGVNVDPRERVNASGEPIGTIIVTDDRTGSIHIQPHEVPELIDELPALAALAAHRGEVRVDGARELRVKESDRVTPRFFETLDRLVA
jgi:3-phosphoshikimate 1-carboxyvinyltransferase